MEVGAHGTRWCHWHLVPAPLGGAEAQYLPTAPSRVTHAMQVVVFAGVMADAAMLAEALELDVWGRTCVGDGE